MGEQWHRAQNIQATGMAGKLAHHVTYPPPPPRHLDFMSTHQSIWK